MTEQKSLTIVDQIESHRELIRETFFKEGTKEQFQLFVEVAKRLGLSPLARQITPMIRNSKNKLTNKMEPTMTIITTIDGFRVIADRSGKYAGQRGPYWCGPDGEWKEAWLEEVAPRAAKVGVLRSDFSEPLWGIATWDSYVQTHSKDGQTRVTSTWAKMPDVMLAKVAEAMALRKAFPNDLSGLYEKSEMDASTPEEETKKGAATYTSSEEIDKLSFSGPGSYVVEGGVFDGQMLCDIKVDDLKKGFETLMSNTDRLTPIQQELMAKTEEYLLSIGAIQKPFSVVPGGQP